MVLLLLACAESEPAASNATSSSTSETSGSTSDNNQAAVRRAPTPSLRNNIPPPGSSTQDSPPAGVILAEGPWSIRTQEGGEAVGVLIALCKRVDPLNGQCLTEAGTPRMGWQEIPVPNVKDGASSFYWPNETKGQESWFISVPKNDAVRPPEIKWKDAFGFAGEPTLEFKGIEVSVVGGKGFAEADKHFRPLGPFAAPTDQSWSYTGSYMGNEKDSCFELVSKNAKGESSKAMLSLNYPAPLNGTVSETLCAPSEFAWPSAQNGTTLTITYTRAGACTCPAGTTKYGYSRKYK